MIGLFYSDAHRQLPYNYSFIIMRIIFFSRFRVRKKQAYFYKKNLDRILTYFVFLSNLPIEILRGEIEKTAASWAAVIN
jgi:TRAP-type mannitol/chloroaromatic compound transport system substrate-binding protein